MAETAEPDLEIQKKYPKPKGETSGALEAELDATRQRLEEITKEMSALTAEQASLEYLRTGLESKLNPKAE